MGRPKELEHRTTDSFVLEERHRIFLRQQVAMKLAPSKSHIVRSLIDNAMALATRQRKSLWQKLRGK